MGERGKSPPGDYVLNLLVTGDDRICVLLGGGFIEHCLEQLLRMYFSVQNPEDNKLPELLNKFFNGTPDNEPFLSGAFRQSALARLLGLISHKHYEICNKIRAMRNTCAHHAGEVYLCETDIDELISKLTDDEVSEFEYW
jgi:hypothetical protein